MYCFDYLLEILRNFTILPRNFVDSFTDYWPLWWGEGEHLMLTLLLAGSNWTVVRWKEGDTLWGSRRDSDRPSSFRSFFLKLGNLRHNQINQNLGNDEICAENAHNHHQFSCKNKNQIDMI